MHRRAFNNSSNHCISETKLEVVQFFLRWYSTKESWICVQKVIVRLWKDHISKVSEVAWAFCCSLLHHLPNDKITQVELKWWYSFLVGKLQVLPFQRVGTFIFCISHPLFNGINLKKVEKLMHMVDFGVHKVPLIISSLSSPAVPMNGFKSELYRRPRESTIFHIRSGLYNNLLKTPESDIVSIQYKPCYNLSLRRRSSNHSLNTTLGR